MPPCLDVYVRMRGLDRLLGERFFWPEWDGGIKAAIGVLPPHLWWWTDDTKMAASIVEVLAECSSIDQDRLAESFLLRYEPWRGYGKIDGGHEAQASG